MPLPPIPYTTDPGWSNCNGQGTQSNADNVYTQYVTQAVTNMTVDEINNVTTQIFENATVTPALVAEAIVDMTISEGGQAAQAMLTYAVSAEQLTATVEIDPSAPVTLMQWTTGEGEPVGLKLTLGQDIIALANPTEKETVYIQTCAVTGENRIVPVVINQPTDSNLSNIFQYIFNYLSALLVCCNSCPEIECRQYYNLDGGVAPPHYPVPYGTVTIPLTVIPSTVKNAEWNTINVQFPVNSTLAAPSVQKLGRFWWIYPDETATIIAEDIQYLALNQQDIKPPRHQPIGFGYVLSPGVTGVISFVPCGIWQNLNAGP